MPAVPALRRAPLVLAVALVLTGCGGGDGSATAIKVGYAYGMDTGDIGDVLAFRELEGRGIASELRDLGGNSEAIIGLTRGDVQLAQVQTAQMLNAIAAGAPVRAVLGQNMISEIVLVGRAGIERVEDLAGKTIAAGSVGGTGDTMVSEALRAASLTRDDVKVVYIDESPTRASAFASGRADAVVLDYVDYELLRRREPAAYTVLDRAADRFPAVPTNSWVVTEEWAEENADLLREIVEGLVAGYERVYSDEGRADWLEEASTTFLAGEPDELIQGIYRFYRDLGQWPRASAFVTEGQHDEATKWWIRSGQTDEPVSFRDSWLVDYWRDADAG